MLDIRKFKTPIQKSNIKLNKNNLFYLREDMIPFSFGGNKVRIAKEFLDDMKKEHGNVLIGYGNARSNLCRVLSNLCFVEKIPCCIISPADSDGNRIITNNYKLVDMCQAKIINCTKENVSDTVKMVIDDYRRQGYVPYYIYGNEYGVGKENIPVRAYAEVVKHIAEFENETGEYFDYIFHASSTGMTQAGLICGTTLLRKKYKIVGISTARKKNRK